MDQEPLRLGKLKKSLVEALHLGEGDNYVYFLSDELDAFARKYPETYLSKIEKIRELLLHPHYGAYKEKTLSLYRLYEEKGKFYLLTITLIKKQKWLFAGIKGDKLPFPPQEGIVQLS